MMEGVFVPVCSSIRDIRQSVKKAMLAQAVSIPFYICEEEYYYPGMLDILLHDQAQVQDLVASYHIKTQPLRCIAVWDSEMREGLALCALDGVAMATYLPLLTAEQLHMELDYVNRLHALAKLSEKMPLYVDQYISPGRYTLVDLLRHIHW